VAIDKGIKLSRRRISPNKRTKKGKAAPVEDSSKYKVNKAEDLQGFRWPPFFEDAEVHLLTQRVYQLDDKNERELFSAMLRRAYEDCMEMEALYHELPAVFANDGDAIRSFREILTGVKREKSDLRSNSQGRSISYYKPIPDPMGGSPCEPQFLIKPYKVLYILQGIERVSYGKREIFDDYLQAVRALWDDTRFLETLYRKALLGSDEDGRDKFLEYLRLHAHDTKIEKSIVHPRADDMFSEIPYGEADKDLYLGNKSFWPPIAGNITVSWPERSDRIPETPLDLCALLEDACRDLVMDGIRLLPTSTNANGIVSISPSSACVGENVIIRGSGFGNTRPTNVNVLIGDRVVNVVNWSDDSITISIPANTKSGCIGFRDEEIEEDRLHIIQENQRVLADASKCLGMTGSNTTLLLYVPSIPPCTGFNSIEIGTPVIESFSVNGKERIIVEPNTTLILHWKIKNGTSFRVRRTSNVGPYVDITDPPGNALAIGKFNGTMPVVATYEIAATNRCGTTRKTVSIELRKTPNLNILGVEVTQGIQRFTLEDSVSMDVSLLGITFSIRIPKSQWDNSLRTIANKDTIIRVYISADLGGFNNDEVDGVTGVLTIDGIFLSPINGTTPSNTAANNPFIKVRRKDRLDRRETDHTLNFRIPAALCDGMKNLTISIMAKRNDGTIMLLRRSLSWNWTPISPFRVRWIRIRDNRPTPPGTGQTPTAEQARFTVERAFDLIPSPITEIAPLAFTPIHPTTSDFQKDDGGSALLNEIRALHNQADALDSTGANIRWIGLTSPPFKGWADGTSCISPIYGIANGKEWSRRKAAHELAHSLGLWHNDKTSDEVAFDPFWNEAIKGTIFSLMSYKSPNWTTDFEWNYLQQQVESVR
jgi:IPT/TIG domain